MPGGFGTNARTPELSDHLSWTKVAEAISSAGTVPGIQLATTWPGYRGQRKFVVDAPGQILAAARQLASKLTQEEMANLLDAFGDAARLAVDHGYRHIQVHAAHGYLPNLLLDRDLNPRYGYVQERLVGLVELLRSQNVETSLRWSMRTGDAEFDQRGVLRGVAEIEAMKFDFIDLSSGYYNIDKRLIYPSTEHFLSQRYDDSMYVANNLPRQNFIISGKIPPFSDNLPENVEIGLCRDLIANPNFIRSGTNGCQNRGKCHYHSRGTGSLTCPTWDQHSKTRL